MEAVVEANVRQTVADIRSRSEILSNLEADGDDPPSRVRLGWTHKVDLDEAWQLRGILLRGHQFDAAAGQDFRLNLISEF